MRQITVINLTKPYFTKSCDPVYESISRVLSSHGRPTHDRSPFLPVLRKPVKICIFSSSLKWVYHSTTTFLDTHHYSSSPSTDNHVSYSALVNSFFLVLFSICLPSQIYCSSSSFRMSFVFRFYSPRRLLVSLGKSSHSHPPRHQRFSVLLRIRHFTSSLWMDEQIIFIQKCNQYEF